MWFFFDFLLELDLLNDIFYACHIISGANKHLMERIAQVEKKIISDEKNDPEAAEKILWSSLYLMKNSPLLTMEQ